MPPSKNITFDELSKYFHLPINQVAKELGVCATILKKICRRNGIPRWPHRKIKSLDKMISNLEVNLAKNPAEREEIKHEVELLKTKKQEIMKNPDILVSKNPNRKGIQKKTKISRYVMKSFKVKELLQAEDEGFTAEETQNCWAPGSNNDSFITAQITAARRPSLPILDITRIVTPTINLPVPVRRHSVDSIPMRNPMDLSQKLPAFQFQHLNNGNLSCIEPPMNVIPDPKSTLPEWFIAEKNRVLGHE